MYELYQGEEKADRYSRESLDRFVRRAHEITKVKHLVKYYREFNRRLEGLRDELPSSERDRLFWKGIPENIQRDAYHELRSKPGSFDRHKAPDMDKVYKLILAIMDKDSIYANVANGWKSGKAKSARDSSRKRHSRKYSTPDSDSDDEAMSDEDKPRHRKKTKRYQEESDSSDSSSNSDSSDSESSEDDQPSRMSRKKSSRSSRHHSKKQSTSVTADKQEVSDVTRALGRLQLMLSQVPNQSADEQDIPRTDLANREPSGAQIIQVMNRMAQEIQENRNDTRLLMDQRRFISSQPSQPSQNFLTRCFFCKKNNTHPRGTFNCPEAQAVVNEGLCKFRNGRIYMPDDSEPPRGAPNESMAVAIRSISRLRNNSAQQGRIPPSRTTQVALAEMIEPEDDGYMTESMLGVSEANPALWQNVFAADRSQPTSQPRFNPISKDNRHVHWKKDKPGQPSAPRAQPYVELPPAPRQWGSSSRPRTATVPAPVSSMPESQVQVPTPQPEVQLVPERILKRQDVRPPAKSSPPIPTKQPESQNRMSVKKSDFVLRGDPRIPNPGPEKILTRTPPRSKFTTNMRDNYDDQALYQQVLRTEVALPLGAILAMSPGLEKKISADTRLHNVPVTQVRSKDMDDDAMDILAGFCQDNCLESQEEAFANTLSLAAPARSVAPRITADAPLSEHYRNVATAYAARREGHSSVPEDRLTAPTGAVILKIGNQEGIAAMVDSGAEMNLVTPELAALIQRRFAVDEAGKAFRMKNASGSINNLRGCFINIPVELGGKRWDSSFFIGDSWDSEFHIILGQPFFRPYSGSINWETIEGIERMFLHLYPGGQRTRPPIVAEMFETNAQRRKGVTSLVGWAEFHDSSSDAPEENRLSNPFIELDSSAEESDTQHIDARDESPPFGLEDFASDSSTADHKEDDGDFPLSDHDGYASASSNDELDSALETGIFSSASGSATQVASTEELERAFHDAANDYRKTARPQSEQLSLERAKEIYQQQEFKALYRIPFGNRALMIAGGEHTIHINSKPFRMLLDPQAHYNVITNKALQQTCLHKMMIQAGQAPPVPTCISSNGLAYCIYVPIDLGTRPILPGLYHITNYYLPGGYDLICGRPWMIGLSLQFARYQFNQSNEPGTPWAGEPDCMDGSDCSSSQPHHIHTRESPTNVISNYHYSYMPDKRASAQRPTAMASASDTARSPDRGGTFARSL